MVNNEMIKKELKYLRLTSLRENAINFIETTFFDALIGMIAAVGSFYFSVSCNSVLI